MPIKPISNHYSFTTPATAYDEEAMTTLELAGRTAAKVNEVVKAFNELDANTDARLTTMENEQIPTDVNATFAENIKNGVFNEMIDEHAGELTQRITNLETSYTPGSTTADAELRDIRANADGQNHATAGDSVRATYLTAKAAIDYIANGAANKAFTMKGTPVDITYTPATIIVPATGEIASTAGTPYKTARIPANELSYYYIKARMNYNGGLIAAIDSNGKLLDIITATTNTVDYDVFDGYYHTPKNTAFLHIAWHNNDGKNEFNGHCYKINEITVSDDLNLLPDIITEFTRLFDSGTGVVFDVTGTPLDVTETANNVINNLGEIRNVATSTVTGYYTAKANVTPGKLYRVKANANYGNAPYAFYDVDGKLVALGETVPNVNTYQHTNSIVSAPANADHIVIAYNVNAGVGEVDKDVKLTSIPGDVKSWKGKKWVCVGDSLTEHNIRADKNYHDYVAEETGITVVNMGLSGSGYAKRSAENLAFYQRIANVPTDADVITIFGSFNDLSAGLDTGTAHDTGVDTLGGCINTTLDKLFEVYPLARVGIVTPTPWTTPNPTQAGVNHPYVALIRDICAARGIPCLDLYTSSGLRPWDATYRTLAYSKDNGGGTHPDETGHKFIAPMFREFIAKML